MRFFGAISKAISRHLRAMRTSSAETIAREMADNISGVCATAAFVAGTPKVLAAIAVLCEELEEERKRWEKAARTGGAVHTLFSGDSGDDDDSEWKAQ